MAATIRAATAMSALPPTRRTLRSCKVRRSLTSSGSGSSAISSRKSVPEPATSNRPAFVSTAPVKLPFS